MFSSTTQSTIFVGGLILILVFKQLYQWMCSFMINDQIKKMARVYDQMYIKLSYTDLYSLVNGIDIPDTRARNLGACWF